ncbi:MAG: tyrosine-type recombinase/integrase [Armatimonadota bacterium]
MRGHVRKRAKGSWTLWIDLGYDETGKRRQKTFTVKGNKREAEAELNRILNELNTGVYVQPAKLTVAEYLERWLTDYAQTNVSPKTLENYTEFVRKHLIPAFGNQLLAKLTPLHIQSYYTRAVQTGRRDGKGGLSARTVLHHHRVLREALQQAVKWQLLARNPADAVQPPRPGRTELGVLTVDQMRTLVTVVRETRLYIPILLAVSTGMRRGEILGLRWRDVDLAAGVISVRQSVQQTRSGLHFKEPKTQKSRRSLLLPSTVVAALVAHRQAQEQIRQQVGAAYDDRDLVVAGPDGKPFSPAAFTQAFRLLVSRTDLPQVRFHDLRHSHATRLFQQGTHPKIVSERLGHSTVGITLDVYSHVLPGMQKEAVLQIDADLREPEAADGGTLPPDG